MKKLIAAIFTIGAFYAVSFGAASSAKPNTEIGTAINIKLNNIGGHIATSEGCFGKIWDFCSNCIATLSGHTGPITSIEFNDAGNNVATASKDCTVKLWDLSGKCIATLSGHNRPVTFVVFNDAGDNIATASEDCTVKLWDLSGKCLVTLPTHADFVMFGVHEVAGNCVFTMSNDGKVKTWDLSGNCFECSMCDGGCLLAHMSGEESESESLRLIRSNFQSPIQPSHFRPLDIDSLLHTGFNSQFRIHGLEDEFEMSDEAKKVVDENSGNG